MNSTKDLVCEFIIKDPKKRDLLTVIGKISESQITDFFKENSPTYVYLQDLPYPPISKGSIREIFYHYCLFTHSIPVTRLQEVIQDKF